MKPVIGIIARSGAFSDTNKFFVNQKIVRAVASNNAIPVLLLPVDGMDYEMDIPSKLPRLTEDNINDLKSMVDKCDGIIIPGGSKWYQFDYEITKYALEKDIPILGICAGMQLLASIFTNKSLPDISVLNTEHLKPELDYVHEVNIKEDSKLYAILKKDKIRVNSLHRSCITSIDPKYITGTTNNYVESIEDKTKKFVLGLQWHPEGMLTYDEDAKLIFKAFIEATKKD